MKLKSVTADDASLIRGYLAERECESSEVNFLTFYIWRKAFDIKYAETDGCLVMRFKDKDSPENFRYPVGSGDKSAALDSIEAHCDGKTVFYGISKGQAERLAARGYKTAIMPGYSDYVYNTKDLIELSGKRYHSKKNHFNTFIKSYDYNYEPMNCENARECIGAYDGWYTNSENDIFLEYEKEAISDILTNFDKLNFCGGVLRADGKICAFTISEQLTHNMAVIHIEKADTAYAGSYAAINKLHLESAWSHMQFVNREEDLGLEGLHKAKSSYRPCRMIDKYKAVKG